MRNRRKFWLAVFLSCAALTLGALIAFCPDFPTPPCSFRIMTGLYCPGCGGTRAFRRLAQGDFLGALRYNPFTVLASPVAIYLFVLHLSDLWRDRSDHWPVLVKTAVVLGGLMFAFFAARNVPLPIFDVLRPD